MVDNRQNIAAHHNIADDRLLGIVHNNGTAIYMESKSKIQKKNILATINLNPSLFSFFLCAAERSEVPALRRDWLFAFSGLNIQ